MRSTRSTHGSLSRYGRESSENTTVIVRASNQLIDKSATDVLKQILALKTTSEETAPSLLPAKHNIQLTRPGQS